MKLEIKQDINVSVLGQYNPIDIWPERQVFIDDKKVPPGLSQIILLGLDIATEQYLDVVEKLMKEGHRL